jgi:hypothetical protein
MLCELGLRKPGSLPGGGDMFGDRVFGLILHCGASIRHFSGAPVGLSSLNQMFVA